MWEGLLKSHFERNIDFLDLFVDFGGLLDLEMVPKVIYGSHWGSQGWPLGALGANLGFVDFSAYPGDPQELRAYAQVMVKCTVPGPYNSITDRRIGGYPRIYIEIS